ncbi:hypothetical protein DFH28DRAFT_1086458 [Melampsora americana]|nr:hypothetical protein DFH28DRAFT_1086458 [Melampsora americana]
MATQTTKECLHSRCSHYEILIPIMANRAGNKPLYTAKAGVDNQPTNSENMNHQRSPSAQPQDIQLTNLSGWEPTQPQSALSGAIKSTPSSQSPMASKTLPHRNFIQPVKKSVSKNPRRSSAGTLGVLKSFQAPLPTQTNFKQMKKATSNSNTVLNLLEARLRNPKATKKHNLDPDDLTPKAIEKKKIKKAKMEELEMLKLERELAQERRALNESNEGSGLSNLQLAREKAELIAKFCLANIPLETAQQMAQEIINSLK